MAQHHTPFNRPRTAFTMVEMAIVLVVVGLLVGAVVGGKALLKQSEMQTIVSDLAKYTAAVSNFRQQYGGLPGDLRDATSFWGSNATSCSVPATDQTPGTCNGDDDNRISTGDEPYRAWQQLVLAKYMEGSFTGVVDAGGGARPGSNVPKARIQGTGWTFGYKAVITPAGSDANQYDVGLDNYLSLGAASATYNTITRGAAFTTTEAYQIDRKVDDGLPATGRVLAYKPSPGTINPNCTTSATDSSAAYALTYAAVACSLQMSLTPK